MDQNLHIKMRALSAPTLEKIRGALSKELTRIEHARQQGDCVSLRIDSHLVLDNLVAIDQHLTDRLPGRRLP